MLKLEANPNIQIRRISKQSKFNDQGKVVFIHLDYGIKNVGLIFLVFTIGSAQTNDMFEDLFNFEDANTYSIFKKLLKICPVQIPPRNRM
jgi:hypothetical protein